MTAEPRGEATALGLEEFRALRATIRERGTLRLLVIALTFMSWAALSAVLASRGPTAGLALIPLVVLAAGFEVVFATHVGVERIGRYLQARYEIANQGPRWEHLAMAGGPSVPGLDPLAKRLFSIATVVNLLPSVLRVASGTVAVVPVVLLGVEALAHTLFLVRLSVAARFASTQRVEDLTHFRTHLLS